MSLESIISGFGGMLGKNAESKANKKALEKNKREQLGVIKSLDFQPTYASDTTPTYQRTESPIARSYLESFLMGTNPNATFSGAPNAAVTRGVQQRQENAMFGTPQERVLKQQAVQASTPWKVTAPTAPVVGAQDKQAMMAAATPELAASGMTPEMQADLVSRGLLKEGQDSKGQYGDSKALSNAYTAGDFAAVERLLDPYGGMKVRGTPRNRRSTVKDRSREIDKLLAKYGG